MSNFKVGDRVVCVDDSDMNDVLSSLKRGNQYIVNRVRNCPCGHVSLDVGIYYDAEVLTTWICKQCPVVKAIDRFCTLFDAARFRKVIEQPRVIRIEVERTEPILN